MNRKIMTVLSILLVLAMLVTACAAPAAAPPAPAGDAETGTTTETAEAAGDAAAEATATAEEAATADAAAEAAAGGEAASGPFTVGLSNNFVGSEWRTQMIQNMQDVNQEFMDAGLTNELVIESADTDAQGQIAQIQNLINKGVDGIIINPGDVNALNPTLEDAVAAGIPVIAVDQEICAEGVINVVIDQKEWARISAQWLAEQLGGEGKVVLIEGFVGHPANEARMAGVQEVLDANPGIEVVGRDTGRWDQATGQQVMSNFLASIPEIDGVWTQDGMASGVLTAIQTANPDNWPIVSGEARQSYLAQWNEVLQSQPDFQSIGVVNPPGVGASGLRVMVNLLQGKELDESQLAGPCGNTLYVPIPPPITNENLADEFAKVQDLPASYTLDSMITQEQADAFFN
jgi:ribose transport system substrate-binding protein